MRIESPTPWLPEYLRPVEDDDTSPRGTGMSVPLPYAGEGIGEITTAPGQITTRVTGGPVQTSSLRAVIG